jgi:hypothetical protein
MNAKTIIASVSLLFAAGAAMADSGLTREQVQQQTLAAIQAGQLERSEAALDNVQITVSAVTGEQVKANTLAAIAAGQLDHSEARDSQTFMVPLVKTGNVKAQLAANAAKMNQQ